MIVRTVVVLVALVTSTAAAQSRRQPGRVGLDEQARLHDIVEDAAAGEPVRGRAWLKCTPHFLRGAEGKTYVPFTLRVHEAPGAFHAAAMYVRVAPRGDEGRGARRADGVRNAVGVAPGDMPVNSPERRQGTGAPTATDASLMLRSLTAKRADSSYPFEGSYGVEAVVENGVATIRRAFAVPPGEYDLYIALVERARNGEREWALLKQPLTVPGFTRGALRVSSLILADRIDVLPAAAAASEQQARPYALGATELIPAADDRLGRDETLHVAFLIYDADIDATGKPDVRVDYRLYEQTFTSDRALGATAPQILNASTLPSTFDLRTGQQLAAMQSLPLGTYKPGTYRLAIRVTDNRSGSSVEENLPFAIVQ